MKLTTTTTTTSTMIRAVLLLLLLAVVMTLAASDEDNDNEPLKVVFAGFGRSGTHSLAAALTKLGYNPCHGSDIVPNLSSGSSHEALGIAMMEYDIDKILQETSKLGYNATLECHAPFWEQIMEKQQQQQPHDSTKYIFMIRDFESWFQSLVQLRYSLAPLSRYPLRFIPAVNTIYNFSTRTAAYTFGHPGDTTLGHEAVVTPESELSYISHKRSHEAFVEKALNITATNDNALLFNIKTDGYKELCEFLEIPDSDCVLEESFPHLGSSSSFFSVWMGLVIVEWIVYSVIGLVIWKIVIPTAPMLLRLVRGSKIKKEKQL